MLSVFQTGAESVAMGITPGRTDGYHDRKWAVDDFRAGVDILDEQSICFSPSFLSKTIATDFLILYENRYLAVFLFSYD
jgi:hypothetical protein